MRKILILFTICICFSAAVPVYAEENVSSDSIYAQLLKVKKQSKRVNLLVELADAYKREGQLDKSLLSCKDVLEGEPDSKQKQKVYTIMGDVYSARKEWSNAIPDYQESISYAPNHEGVRISLAWAYEQSDLYELASQEYLKILEMNPKSFEANVGIANLYQKEGFENKAVRYYRVALSVKMDARAYSNLAACYESRGDNSLAVSMLKNAIAIEPSYMDYINLGRLYSENKKYKDAVEAFRMAEKIDAKAVDAYIYLGMLYTGENELEPARKILLHGNEECPGNALIHFFLGNIYNRQNMPALAAQEMRKSAELATGSALRGYSEKYLAFLQKKSN